MHFWAGGQEINTVFREGKGMWMDGALSVCIQVTAGGADASISSETPCNSLLFD